MLSDEHINNAYKLLEQPKNIAISLIGNVTDILNTPVTRALNLVSSILENTGKNTISDTHNLVHSSKIFLEASRQYAFKHISDMLGYSPGWWDTIRRMIENVVNELLKPVWKAIDNAYKAIDDKITSLLDTLKDNIKTLFGQISDWIVSSISYAHEKLDTAYKKLENLTLEKIDYVSDILSPFAQTLMLGWKFIITSLRNLLTIKAEDLMKLQEDMQKLYWKQQFKYMGELKGGK